MRINGVCGEPPLRADCIIYAKLYEHYAKLYEHVAMESIAAEPVP